MCVYVCGGGGVCAEGNGSPELNTTVNGNVAGV